MRVPFLDLHAGYEELRGELDAAALRVLDSGRYIAGPEANAFEQEFASFCGVKECVGVGNGLDAITLILKGYGIGEGDEVIVPAFTFIATWLAVSATGAVPVPVHVDPVTCNLDPVRVESAVTPQTRAVVAVHLYGYPADMDALSAISNRHNLKLIEDSAQAHGAVYTGHRAGALGNAAAFSFYPGKNLGAFGDGGAVTTDDTELAGKVRMLGNYGSREKYSHEVAGCNSRLDPLQSALLRVKLRCLDEWNVRRKAVAARYMQELSGVDKLTLPAVASGIDPAWHLFVVQTAQRDRLQQFLSEQGVETLIHYPVAPHQSGAYAGLFAKDAERLRPAQDVSDRVLSLPIGPHLSEDQQGVVIEAVRQFFNRRNGNSSQT